MRRATVWGRLPTALLLSSPHALHRLCPGSAWQSQAGDCSIPDATCWGQEPKRFCLPESNANCVGWSCCPCCQHALSSSGWLRAAPAGLAAWQPAGHAGHTAQPWANPPTPTPQPSPASAVSPSPPAISLVPSSQLLPSGCSGATQLLASTLNVLPALAAHHQHQGHPARWGRAMSAGTGAAAQPRWDTGQPLPWLWE